MDSSGILETYEMRQQVIEEIKNIYPGMKNLKKLYSTEKFGKIDTVKFHESCVNHEITFSFAKSNYNKVIGFLSPMKWRFMDFWTRIPGGKTKIVYFDE